ncbi:GlsB/YeaQ/YmgE family stress response membrane protein [Sphingomonas ginkgonis]|uniref:GlsB/YeaQ/YmgE family stress response membrane protein n=1 Tax=Sphingomonas ginkgonis TaxID=2315330 RepID=A0A3R9WS16_9SPHN|nr:GlsB/YeaQ/YmgE family stress response membrane protein [Sphingomonas ginkgonis]RST31956.1 GlsB/YeaQ/YmgE family stress response membrane protein [Sphingomonas ginkgonis]
MGILIWLIVGGVCGWLASIIMRTDGQQGIILNVIVGIVGAAIAGFLLGGGADLNHGITLTSFLYSLLGAVVLLAIVNLVRRGTVR